MKRDECPAHHPDYHQGDDGHRCQYLRTACHQVWKLVPPRGPVQLVDAVTSGRNPPWDGLTALHHEPYGQGDRGHQH